MSMKLGYECEPRSRPRCVSVSKSATSEFGSGNGKGRSSTAFTTLKIAVLAPIPSASAIVATMLTLGDFSNMRSPNRMSCIKLFIIPTLFVSSFVSQRLEWIDSRCTSRREVTRNERHSRQQHCHKRNRERIGGGQPNHHAR